MTNIPLLRDGRLDKSLCPNYALKTVSYKLCMRYNKWVARKETELVYSYFIYT